MNKEPANETTATPELFQNPRLGNIAQKLESEFFRLRANHFPSIIENAAEPWLADFLLKHPAGQKMVKCFAKHFWMKAVDLGTHNPDGQPATYYEIDSSDGREGVVSDEISDLWPDIKIFLNTQCFMEITLVKIASDRIGFTLK